MIKDTFKKYGDNYFLMSVVSDRFHIYRREHLDGRLAGYEIMIPIMVGGELCLPSSSFWGIYGWTCMTEVAVVKKINELLKK